MSQNSWNLWSSTLGTGVQDYPLVTTSKSAQWLASVLPMDARLISSAAILVAAATWIIRSSIQKRYRVPGPPRHFLLGNLLQLPSNLAFKQFTKWAQEYGMLRVVYGFPWSDGGPSVQALSFPLTFSGNMS